MKEQHQERNEALELFEEAAEQEETGTAKLGELGRLVQQHIELEDQIAEKSKELKALQRQLDAISQDKIPSLMLDEIQLSEIRLQDGSRIQVKDAIKVSTTGKWREAINEWLAEIGEEDLIKDEIKIGLGCGQGELANEMLEILTRMGVPYDRKQYVAPPSLNALIRELLDQGEDVDLDRIGAYIYRVTKIVRA